jgi:aminoacyl tRNA synthase complex-interacting multifunctional protein 1
VREIASGLQAHFTLEQMKGQRVVVVRNLKPRPLAGFASNGMVLCATHPDGKVEFVEPPVGAALGERVSFEGHAGPAAEPNRVAKKKIFEAVAPLLQLNDEGAATWDGVPMMTSSGPCKCATLKGSQCPVK